MEEFLVRLQKMQVALFPQITQAQKIRLSFGAEFVSYAFLTWREGESLRASLEHMIFVARTFLINF
jgi:hypothetical protein